MHTFNAHAATDITGFGILGHAQNLAKQQRNEVSFVIHNLPVLAKMAAVSKACGNMFGLMHGTCPETSGKRLFFKKKIQSFSLPPFRYTRFLSHFKMGGLATPRIPQHGLIITMSAALGPNLSPVGTHFSSGEEYALAVSSSTIGN